ncbi:hypothetical protein [Brevibacterium atlanticum]|uniref:hypothetical protein n=1 Tax=Brevibacterium atlanticum TaxID=2697563 RepID=UPI00141EC5D1|nr:hypothetical protein [Brevibacterium atlanticum]
MPEQPDETVPCDGDQSSEVEREHEPEAEPTTDAGAEADSDADASAAAERRARLEAAKRRYRATLRNEADSGGGGFSEDYYRSQKPPHWS